MNGKGNALIKTFFLTLSMLLLMSASALAQAGSPAPRGTYLKTCGNIRLTGNTLTATCATNSNPGYFTTSINVAACEGDIWNDVGVLACYARRGTWGEGQAIPRGSYLESSWRPHVSGTVLYAWCKDRSGKYNTNAYLDLKSCRMGSNIANIDGQLVCIQ